MTVEKIGGRQNDCRKMTVYKMTVNKMSEDKNYLAKLF